MIFELIILCSYSFFDFFVLGSYSFNFSELFSVAATVFLTELILHKYSVEGYVAHESLTNRFHVTHCGGCAVLFNKDTFFPDVKVISRRVLPDKVVEGDSGWVLQAVLSWAFFRRQPPSGQKTFTVLSLHISDIYAKKRGIGKNLILTIRAVMLNEKADLVPMPPSSTLLCSPGAVPGEWADVCGILNHPSSNEQWKVRQDGAFSILHSP